MKEELVIPPDNPPMITDLLLRMLRKDPSKRATIEEVAQHPWIRTSVFAIYFEKGFLNSLPPQIGRQEAASLVEKLRLNPANIPVEGTEEFLLALIVARKKLAEITNPANAIGRLPPPIPQPKAISELTPETCRKSLINLMGQTSGVTARKSQYGPGRVIVRSSRRQSASLLTIPRLESRGLTPAPSDS
jgi:serine/threonine protein kinase